MTAKTNKERQAGLKARRMDAGLKRFSVWAHAEDGAKLKQYAVLLIAERQMKGKR